MLKATSYVIDNVTPVKIVDSATIDGEYEVLIQPQFSAMIGDATVAPGGGFQIDPVGVGIGDPAGILRLRLQNEDLYAVSRVVATQIINVMIYSA